MRIWTLLAAVSLFAGSIGIQSASAELDFVADLRPGTLLLAGDAGDFEVEGPGPDRLGIREVEEAGSISSIPNLRLGVGLRSPDTFLDLTGQAGVLVNQRFRSLMLGADVSFMYRLRKNVAMGPHIGLAYFMDPEWTGDADIDIDDTSGVIGGFQIAIGYDILFLLSVDYVVTAPMDIEESGDWIASDDELEISGLAIQFGMQGRF